MRILNVLRRLHRPSNPERRLGTTDLKIVFTSSSEGTVSKRGLQSQLIFAFLLGQVNTRGQPVDCFKIPFSGSGWCGRAARGWLLEACTRSSKYTGVIAPQLAQLALCKAYNCRIRCAV